MKVYRVDAEGQHLVGRADIPADSGPVFEVRLFGAASIIRETYSIGTVTHHPAGQAGPVVERVVLLEPNQPPDFLPRCTLS